MSVFGPFYPAELQRSINHAERFARAVARALAELPLAPPNVREREPTRPPLEPRSRAELWLLGRADEIEIFVGAIAVDWRMGKTSGLKAAATVERYLADLHRVFVAIADGGAPPACCRPSEATVDADVLNLRLAIP